MALVEIVLLAYMHDKLFCAFVTFTFVACMFYGRRQDAATVPDVSVIDHSPMSGVY
jgi:hypothetical protein